ncbi:MAG TPA: hypothetical protein VFU06_09875 [Longimicrobiales bacterium]|nr:hypothetical protein [Longimicrobiales bacterium]
MPQSRLIAVTDQTELDAHRTSGTSPTDDVGTVHLLGAGAVGRALLQRIALSGRRLVAVSDSTATVAASHGLDPLRILAWKAAGRALAEWPGAWRIPTADAVARVDAGVVVDATATRGDRPEWTALLDAVLARGSAIALAAKDAIAERSAAWLTDSAGSVGCNAVLGGTGQQLARELPELRRRWREAAIVGNASTTTILECIERGGTLAEGIEEANQRGYLEADPELDLRGRDAAVKLAVVAGALRGERIDADTIQCEDIRSLDHAVIRERVARGATTRLVARATPHGVHAGYEEVDRSSALASPVGRVVYRYDLTRNERRLHIGGGLGAAATADALWVDVVALGSRTQRIAATVSGVAR